MKTMKKILSSMLAPATIILLVAAGCTNDIMDKINRNPNDPSDVSVDYILPDVIARSAVSLTGGDIALYASVYMELEAGVHGQLFNAEIRKGEVISSATYNNSWGAFYNNISFIKTIFQKCDEGSSGGPVTKGMAQVLLAMNIATLTNYFGDVPYSQSAVLDKNKIPVYPQPIVDKQKTIYEAVFALLDDAIVNLGKGTGAPSKTSDWIYQGNTALWIKAANALKARYTLQLRNKSSDQAGDLTKILGYIEASFAKAEEQFAYDQFKDANSYNPLYAFYTSRKGLASSGSFVDLLAEKKDPRVMQWGFDFQRDIKVGEKTEKEFNPKWADSIPKYIAKNIDKVPNGLPTETEKDYSRYKTYFVKNVPVHLMSYHELMFIKAEVLARQNQKDLALAALKTALLAACANVESYLRGGLTSAVAEEYFTNTVTPAFNANPLNEVMLQKYLACSGANAEAHVAYDDYRRMKASNEGGYLTLKNPRNADGKFPLRFAYGVDDVSANPNITPLYGNGQYVYTENVWWAGGTR